MNPYFLSSSESIRPYLKGVKRLNSHNRLLKDY